MIYLSKTLEICAGPNWHNSDKYNNMVTHAEDLGLENAAAGTII